VGEEDVECDEELAAADTVMSGVKECAVWWVK
jgi:hypothetical protein